MKLIAVKALRYGGKRQEVGSEFDADDKWGDLLQRTGQARLSGTDQLKRGRGRPRGPSNRVVTNDTSVTGEDLVQRTDSTHQDTP